MIRYIGHPPSERESLIIDYTIVTVKFVNEFICRITSFVKTFQCVKQVHLPYSSSNFIQVFIDKVDYASGQLKCILFVCGMNNCM